MTRLFRRCAPLAGIVGLAAALAWIPGRADAPADHAAEVTAATEQAAQWLDALDAHRYDEGWSSLAAVMTQGRTVDDFKADISGPREELGKPILRQLRHAEFSTTVRGAPTGSYVTVSYLSQFSNAPPVLETILLMLEDRRWRIGGYSVAAAAEAPAPAAPAAGAPGG
jgi:hypothetical protein